MTNEESWRVAWETVLARIDDLASCLHSVGASVPLTISELQDVNQALGRLDEIRLDFYDSNVPRLIETATQTRHG